MTTIGSGETFTFNQHFNKLMETDLKGTSDKFLDHNVQYSWLYESYNNLKFTCIPCTYTKAINSEILGEVYEKLMEHSIQFFSLTTALISMFILLNEYLRYLLTYAQISPFIYIPFSRIHILQKTVAYSKACSPLFCKPVETPMDFTVFKMKIIGAGKSYLAFHSVFPTDMPSSPCEKYSPLFFFSLQKNCSPHSIPWLIACSCN